MTGSGKALLIATDSYSDPEFSRLQAPAADVAGLHAVLSHPAIGGYAATRLLNASEPEVTRAIEDFFAAASRDDLLLLYVSGHGVKDEDGQLYLATADSRHDRLGSTSVPARFLHEQMNRSRCRRIVVLLDCCYSGAFPSGLRHRGADRVDVLSQLGGRGYAVMTSSSALGYSYEATGASVFTGIVINGLRTGEADLGGDGLIDIDELYDYAYDRVIAAVPGQRPQKKFELDGTLYIASSVRGRRAGPSAPDGADGNPVPPASFPGEPIAAAPRITPSEPAGPIWAVRAVPGAASPLPGQYTASERDGEAQPRTGTPEPPGTWVTVSNSRSEMISREIGRQTPVLGALCAMLGMTTHDFGLGPRILHALSLQGNFGPEFFLGVTAGALGLLLGVISGIGEGARATSDALTLDSAKLTVTRRYYIKDRLGRRRRRDVYYWLWWSDIGRITVEDSKRGAVLRVWFRPSRSPPTAEWLAANAVRIGAYGSFDIYHYSDALSRGNTVDVRRLRAQLPRYAGQLYVDPGYPPGP